MKNTKYFGQLVVRVEWLSGNTPIQKRISAPTKDALRHAFILWKRSERIADSQFTSAEMPVYFECTRAGSMLIDGTYIK